MVSVLHIISTIIIIAEFVWGNLSNGLIVLKNCLDWMNIKELSTLDQILILLAISRISLIWETFLMWVKDKLISSITIEELKMIMFSFMLSSHFSLWLATALSTFYLFRIANCSRQIFLYLKWRLKHLIVQMLLGSMIFLIANIIQITVTLEKRFYQYEGNTSVNSIEKEFAILIEMMLFNMTIFSVIPFLLALISFILLIFSLWKHLQRMQLNSREDRDPSTKAHRNALGIMVSFLLLYTMYVLSLLISWIAQKNQSELVHIICMITSLLNPSVHSSILILGNCKLKQSSLCILKHLGCRLKSQNTPTT
ncbi:taste receptor type 2 member 124 [Rattus rattus]|uniref:taste receptor type 2 member 124 n=1 Tax=Rattus rattus TaxID=10117 RepID=UPI0013F39607|nr:taste receptor type 2 member 124 [Rattus rattus]